MIIYIYIYILYFDIIKYINWIILLKDKLKIQIQKMSSIF